MTNSEELQFTLNLATVLAHTVWFEHKQEALATCVDDAHMGGDDAPRPTTETTASMMQAVIENLPKYLDVNIGQLPKLEQAFLDSNARTADQSNQQNLDVFKRYAPEYNQIGSDIMEQNALNQAKSDAKVVSGPGRELVSEAYETSQIFDKPWYDAREADSKAVMDLLASIDINKLSGGERSEMERSLAREGNRRGTGTSPSNIETLAAANQTGTAMQAKRDSLASAISVANNFLGTSKSGVDAFQVATGRPSAVNQGEGKGGSADNSAASKAAANVFDSSNAILGQAGNIANTTLGIEADRRDSLDRVTGVLGSLPNIS
jgi:hypothetical protein